LEQWSIGFKSGNTSYFYSFTFGNARSKHGLYFSTISNIHHSNTPALQVLSTLMIKSGGLPFTNAVIYTHGRGFRPD
jgi:hypothetical protein